MKKITVFIIFITLLMILSLARAETKTAFDERMRWWRDAKFGLFIHWGPYAVPAGVYNGQNSSSSAEWLMYNENIPVPVYEEYARQFKPVQFDATYWAKLAKAAGMKYLIITSKHHDGFCMWNSRVSGYDLFDFSPFKRDVLKELAAACKKQGIRLGFYYSIMDWHHPDAKYENFPTYRDTYMKPQLRELLTQYGKIAVLWFDGEWIEEWSEGQGKDLYRFVRGLQPQIIINNRVGKGRSGMQGMSEDATSAGDFGTPEQEILNQGNAARDWESCMTMNDSWGYKKFDENWKSSETLIQNLIEVTAKGGNYLLNVGPTAAGLIPDESIYRLREMGRWLRVNGAAIYATRTLPEYKEGENIYYTRSKSGATIYAIHLGWPGKQVKLRYVAPKKGSKIYLLGYKKALTWRNNRSGEMVITLPASLQRAANRPCKYAYVFKINGRQLKVSAAPQISTSKHASTARGLFLEQETVRLTSPEPAATIYYTLDGSTPTSASSKYQDAITLSESIELKAVALETGKVASPVAAARFTRINRVKRLMLEKPPSVKYAGWGELSLINGEYGGLDYHDPQWVGFEKDDLDATIDLGAPRLVHQIRLSCLEDQNAWIFLPAEIQLFFSVDGLEYIQSGDWKAAVKPSAKAQTYELSIAFTPQEVRYIRLKVINRGLCPEWHKGTGGKAWLFADEIIIE